MPLPTLTTFLGANTRVDDPRFLPPGVGVVSLNQKPNGGGDFRPWRQPLAIAGPIVPAGRTTLYRMGRETASLTAFWLCWASAVHVTRGFDTADPTERTYYTGNGSPKATDNILALASPPYPTASREMAVPQPTLAPGVVLNVDGATGEARSLYYCFTWVNDWGWEGAPSPPVLAPLAKPGAILDLSIGESVPSGAYSVTKVRWYRTQTTNALGDAEFFFLREYAVGAGGMQDDARELGTDVLPTEASTIRLALPSNAHSLTMCWNNFAAALVNKTVRFCEPTLIYAWPLSNEYEVADMPIAQAAFAQRLLVLTSAGAELFTGSDPEAMDRKPMALAPIVAARSLVVGETFCTWAAADGLWTWGLDGYRNLTGECLKPEQWAALAPTTMHCHYFEIGNRPLIVGFYNDGALKGFVVDPANPLGIYMLETGYTAAYWDKLQRKLFVLDGSTLKLWDADGAFMTATFKGKLERQEADTEAEWIEVLAGGSTTVKLHVDGVMVYDHALTTGEHRPENGTVGRDWQLEIVTATSTQGVAVS